MNNASNLNREGTRQLLRLAGTMRRYYGNTRQDSLFMDLFRTPEVLLEPEFIKGMNNTPPVFFVRGHLVVCLILHPTLDPSRPFLAFLSESYKTDGTSLVCRFLLPGILNRRIFHSAESWVTHFRSKPQESIWRMFPI